WTKISGMVLAPSENVLFFSLSVCSADNFFTEPVICYFLDGFLIIYCIIVTGLFFREKVSYSKPFFFNSYVGFVFKIVYSTASSSLKYLYGFTQSRLAGRKGQLLVVCVEFLKQDKECCRFPRIILFIKYKGHLKSSLKFDEVEIFPS
uniref:Uncharacterized protein n=1 Tax=Pundamilia nyererei TaxID=303518 RepID=A0A3B4G8J5_9CICH